MPTLRSLLPSLLPSLLMLIPAYAAAATTTTVVDVPTRGVTQRFLYVRPDAPKANIVALPGGEGVLAIQDDGTVAALPTRCFPLYRTRQALSDLGYAVALVDQTSDYEIRRYEDVLEVIRYLRARDKVPVWVFGGSSSTEAAANIASKLPADIPAAVAFFSPDPVPPAIAASVTRPALIIYNSLDGGARPGALYTSLTSAPVRQQVALNGGNPGGCGYHLFQGLESEFVAGVSGFIEQVNPTLVAAPPPAGAALAVEFYNGSLDHYFVTHIANEIALLDAGVTIKGWVRTGESFYVYPAALSNSSPVCRFYIPPDKGNSHFYGRGTAECNATGAANPTFVNEDPQFFHMVLPALGVCPAGTRNVYRTFSARVDANHRYMVDPAIRDQMVTNHWLAEGDGANLVVMCSPV